MIVRKAKKDDLTEILELYHYLFKEEDYSNINLYKNKWKENLRHDGLSYFVLSENKKILSSCNVSISPNLSRGQRSYALIENVITHPDYRRKGYGKAVIEEVIKFAKAENCYKIMLLSTVSNERNIAHKFYNDMGFDGDSKKGFNIRFS